MLIAVTGCSVGPGGKRTEGNTKNSEMLHNFNCQSSLHFVPGPFSRLPMIVKLRKL